MDIGSVIDDALNDKNNIIKRFLDIFDASNEGLWEMTPDNQVNFYNTHFYSRFDINLNNSHLNEWLMLIHPDDTGYFSDNITRQMAANTERFKSRYRVRDKSGQYRWIEAVGVTKFDEQRQLLYMVGSHKDITEEKQNEERIYQFAYVDPLTGLLNRYRLTEAIRDKIAAHRQGALLYINLTGFRAYNDTFGHNAGNQVLLSVADCLKATFTDDSLLCRLHADEFAVLVTHGITEAELGDRLEALQQSFHQRVDAAHNHASHRMNIGICMLPSDANCEESLIYRAKLTMRYAKEHANIDYAFFDKDNQYAVQKRLYIETGMKSAITNGEFFLKYQPIVAASTGRAESFEALVRWNSDQYGEIFPDEFIPVAERNRDIIELGYHVLEQACGFIGQYNRDKGTELSIAVNISVLQLLQEDFPNRVLDTISRHQLQPTQLLLEVTESLMLDSNTFAKEQIVRLRQQGIAVALDDFGTGYSSLNSFFNIPFTQLKIDRQVINKAMKTTEAAAYVSFLADLCRERNIQVVGEGIESETMARLAEDMGLSLLQGYFFSRPVLADDARNID